MQKLLKINKDKLDEILEILPKNYYENLKINITDKLMTDDFNERIHANYNNNTREINLYGLSHEEISSNYYISVIYHEIGHYVFKNLLSKELKIDWSKAREKEVFPIELEDIYGKLFLWEE